MLINRLESKDTVFLWQDFIDKNNNELLKNLDKFSNRCLKYLEGSLNSVIPEYEEQKHEADAVFIKTLLNQFNQYVTLMEDVKLKDALKLTMDYSSQCNTYYQDCAPWVLAKKDSREKSKLSTQPCKLSTSFLPFKSLSCPVSTR